MHFKNSNFQKMVKQCKNKFRFPRAFQMVILVIMYSFLSLGKLRELIFMSLSKSAWVNLWKFYTALRSIREPSSGKEFVNLNGLAFSPINEQT